MANRLAASVSPYLLSHADNPVDWFPWGPDAFAEAARRDVPVLISIGYSTCHWCHVMARESFSDVGVAAYLNQHFVAIKVDREEHPDVDSAYLAAAGAFTPNLGWPLTVFTTPTGRAFHAGTYSPPRPVAGQASFRQVLEAVTDAWAHHRDDVEQSAAGLAEALAQAAAAAPERRSLDDAAFAGVLSELLQYEDPQHGGFGGAPKFPVAPALLFLAALARTDAGDGARGVVDRALHGMTTGGLFDPIDGGFFRYATRRDWSVPHYERMLTDNALLLQLAAAIRERDVAEAVVRFLRDVLQQPDGGFGSAQDSESVLDGMRDEGGYYALDARHRSGQPAPAVDRTVLTGWNGLAIRALAAAGTAFAEPDWIHLAERTADALITRHRRADGRLLHASLEGRKSHAQATLHDYGAFADGLLEVALAAGRVDLAVVARELIDACLTVDGFAVPGGGDPVLAGFGIAEQPIDTDGATPSGVASAAAAAWRLSLLTADERYADASRRAIGGRAAAATAQPLGFGATLEVALAQSRPVVQLVVVADSVDDRLVAAARSMPTSVTAVVTPAVARAFAAAGFDLFADRGLVGGMAAAYLCRDFVCRLPTTDPEVLLRAP